MSLPILAIGQSNIEGGFGPALPAPAHDKAVRAYNLQTRQWAPAQLGVSPFRNIVRSSAPAHNFVYEFAHRYASLCEDDADLVLWRPGANASSISCQARFYLLTVGPTRRRIRCSAPR